MSELGILFERNQEATIYVGNIDQKVTEDILWELFTQCAPVIKIYLPKDKITLKHQGFAFIEFRTKQDAEYAIKVMHMIKLYNKPINVNTATQDKRTQEIGADLFIGNLSEDVDEKKLKDTFSVFGVVLSTKIMKDPETGISKHYGFVSYDNFDSSDAAIKKLNGQYLSGKPIFVDYAYKQDTKGEKHGSLAERILAGNRPINSVITDNKIDESLATIKINNNNINNEKGKKSYNKNVNDDNINHGEQIRFSNNMYVKPLKNPSKNN